MEKLMIIGGTAQTFKPFNRYSGIPVPDTAFVTRRVIILCNKKEARMLAALTRHTTNQPFYVTEYKRISDVIAPNLDNLDAYTFNGTTVTNHNIEILF